MCRFYSIKQTIKLNFMRFREKSFSYWTLQLQVVINLLYKRQQSNTSFRGCKQCYNLLSLKVTAGPICGWSNGCHLGPDYKTGNYPNGTLTQVTTF